MGTIYGVGRNSIEAPSAPPKSLGLSQYSIAPPSGLDALFHSGHFASPFSNGQTVLVSSLVLQIREQPMNIPLVPFINENGFP